MNWIEIVVNILTGLAIVIPLVVKLVQYVQCAAKEKNWNALLKMTIEYMKTAEEKFSQGSERKAWVLGMIQTSANTINYDLDDAAMAKIGDLIDSICEASHIINKELSGGNVEPAAAE